MFRQRFRNIEPNFSIPNSSPRVLAVLQFHDHNFLPYFYSFGDWGTVVTTIVLAIILWQVLRVTIHSYMDYYISRILGVPYTFCSSLVYVF